MTNLRTRLAVAGIVAMLATLSGAAVSVGYIDQSQTRVIISGPNVVRCNRSATINVRVVSSESGRPIRNQIVSWSLAQTQSGGDGLSSGSSTTNRRGRASVTLSFGPVAGPRTVHGSAGDSSSAVTVRCAGGLPRTSTRPPDGYVEGPANALLLPSALPADPASGDPTPATGLRMSRLGIDLPIVEGDGLTAPEGAAAHYPGTAWPGEGSNTFVYAHAREGQFLELWQVRTGDLIEVDLADGAIAEYRVSEIRPVVPWDALDLLAPTSEEILTLQTCLTYEDTAPRFVVIAQRIPTA